MKKPGYILLLMLTLPMFMQAQQTWTGLTDNDWSTATNWSPQVVPDVATNVVIPLVESQPIVDGSAVAVCNNLTLQAGVVLTINSRRALTVYGQLTNNSGIGIDIKCDNNGTGSLIVNMIPGIVPATVERWMLTGKWNYTSSPVSGQNVNNFLSKNPTIAENAGKRGMMDYNPASNAWNPFFTDASTGFLGGGKGYSMRTTTNSIVTFSGSLQVGVQSISVVADKWNCIGNPYTSAIRITAVGTSPPENFLTVNAGNIDSNFGAVYVWDKTDASNDSPGKYLAISNVPTVGGNEFQQGQAFFVKMGAGKSSVNFTPAMQLHSGRLPLKSASTIWPTINLSATVNNQTSSTLIAFDNAMTKGLDPTYDAGLMKGGTDLIIYSRLVEDNGIPFAIQALPDNIYKGMVIPVGLDFITGGEVVFSAELLNLPSECKVILEDKLTKTLTDLSKDNYKVAVAANSVIADRFQLHTSDLTSKLENNTLSGTLKAYAISNLEIRVIGEVSDHCIARLYNVQGSVVLIKNLEAGNLNVIPTQAIKNGIYMLSVEDQGKAQTFKLLIRE